MARRSSPWPLLLLLPCPLLLSPPAAAEAPRAPAAEAPRAAPAPEAPRGRPWLGLSIEKGAAGVRVREVMPDSPCATTDLRPGDEVLAVDEERLQTPSQLIAAVQKAGLGAKVSLLVRSPQGTERKVPVLLQARPNMGEWQRQGLLGKPAPDFQPKVIGGAPLGALSETRGDVVLIDFFASWCGPCMAALPDLAALWQRHGGKGLRIVGVSAETAEVVGRVVRERRIPYTVAMDVGEQASRAYRIHAFPTMFVLDRKGVVRAVTNDVEEATQAALAALGEGAARPKAR